MINLIREKDSRFIKVKFHKQPAYKAGKKFPATFDEVDNVLTKTGHKTREEKETRILQMEFRPLVWLGTWCYFMERETAEADPAPLFFQEN